jgi:hypothetical protein
MRSIPNSPSPATLVPAPHHFNDLKKRKLRSKPNARRQRRAPSISIAGFAATHAARYWYARRVFRRNRMALVRRRSCAERWRHSSTKPHSRLRACWRDAITALNRLAPVQSCFSKLLVRQDTHPKYLSAVICAPSQAVLCPRLRPTIVTGQT